MADYSKDDAETRRARQEAHDMAEQSRNERLYESSRTNPFKAGGHVHHSEHYGKHAEGHKMNKDMVKKHSAGHKHHDDHVMAMCSGGKTHK